MVDISVMCIRVVDSVSIFGLRPVSMWIVGIFINSPGSLKVALWVLLVVDIMLVIWEWCHIVALVVLVAQLWVGVMVDVVFNIMVNVLMWVNHNWLRVVVNLVI